MHHSIMFPRMPDSIFELQYPIQFLSCKNMINHEHGHRHPHQSNNSIIDGDDDQSKPNLRLVHSDGSRDFQTGTRQLILTVPPKGRVGLVARPQTPRYPCPPLRSRRMRRSLGHETWMPRFVPSMQDVPGLKRGFSRSRGPGALDRTSELDLSWTCLQKHNKQQQQ